MSDRQTIRVFTSANDDDFGLLHGGRQVELPVETLHKNLVEFIDALENILPTTNKPVSGMELKTISVAVGVNGKGQVGFLGTGVEVGGQATLTLTFGQS